MLHPKVGAGALAGALSIIVMWFVQQATQITVPEAVAQSVTVVFTFITSYFVPSDGSA